MYSDTRKTRARFKGVSVQSMNFSPYGVDYLAVLTFFVTSILILFESEDPGSKRSFITAENFHGFFWGGASLIVLGVVLHLTIGQLGPSPVDAQPSETVNELLMLQRVSYRTSIAIALGYAFMFCALVLKVSNMYFIFKADDEKDI